MEAQLEPISSEVVNENGPRKVVISIKDYSREKRTTFYGIEANKGLSGVKDGVGLVEYAYKEPIFLRIREIEKKIAYLHEAKMLKAKLHFHRIIEGENIFIELIQSRTTRHFLTQSPMSSKAMLKFQLDENCDAPAELDSILSRVESILSDGAELKKENALESLGGCMLRWVEQGTPYLSKYLHADLTPAGIGKRNLKILRTIYTTVALAISLVSILLV